MNQLPQSRISPELSKTLRNMGTIWAQSEDRPRLSPVIISHWDKLLEAWGASDLPLIIRKSSGIRGSLLMHSSGRGIILSDNSPAQWSFSRAFEGQLLKLEDALEMRLRLVIFYLDQENFILGNLNFLLILKKKNVDC